MKDIILPHKIDSLYKTQGSTTYVHGDLRSLRLMLRYLSNIKGYRPCGRKEKKFNWDKHEFGRVFLLNGIRTYRFPGITEEDRGDANLKHISEIDSSWLENYLPRKQVQVYGYAERQFFGSGPFIVKSCEYSIDGNAAFDPTCFKKILLEKAGTGDGGWWIEPTDITILGETGRIKKLRDIAKSAAESHLPETASSISYSAINGEPIESTPQHKTMSRNKISLPQSQILIKTKN
jgi:hypothetical protein